MTNLSDLMARRDALIKEVATLIPVAAIDMDDIYGDHTFMQLLYLDGLKGNLTDWDGTPRGRSTQKLAACLVDRIIGDPGSGVIFDWTEPPK